MARKNRQDRLKSKTERQRAATGDTRSVSSSSTNMSRGNAPGSRIINKNITTPPDLTALSDLAAGSYRVKAANAALPRTKRTLSNDPTPPRSLSGGNSTRPTRNASERGKALSSDAPSINDGASITPPRLRGVVSSTRQQSSRRSSLPQSNALPTTNSGVSARSNATAISPGPSPRQAVAAPAMGIEKPERRPMAVLQPPAPIEALDKAPESPPKCKKRPDSREARKGPGGSRAFIPWCKK